MGSTAFIDIQIIGDDAGVARMLKHLDTAMNPLAIAEFLGIKIGPYLQERAKQRFKHEGDDVVGSWAPLKPATQDIRRLGRESQGWDVGDAHPINQRTHKLERYITGNAGSVNAHSLGATLTFPKKSAAKGLRDKMSTAQMGRNRPPTVARPVLGMNEADLLFVITQLAFHIKEPGRGD